MKKNEQSPVNTCKNTFIEADGFCNACGKRHYNPRKDASKQRFSGKDDPVVKSPIRRVIKSDQSS
jgi:hypothetical protein